MPDFMEPSLAMLHQLAWPVALALAWIIGEWGRAALRLPTITLYGVAGFSFGNLFAGYIPAAIADMFTLVANMAFGLMLFELGYRINLRWLRDNPWIAVTGMAESSLTFAVVAMLGYAAGLAPTAAMLLAALAMSTSPASVLRVVNEERAAGQVSERILHLSAVNCILAVTVFKVIVGLDVFVTTGNVLHALWSSLAVLAVSCATGALAGMAVPAWLRRRGTLGSDGTAAFAVGVLLLVAATHTLRLSPIAAALAFGLVARHRRVTLSRAQRNFGVLGDLLCVVLFFYVGAAVSWSQLLAGGVVAVLLVLARTLVKTLATSAFARASGISVHKGVLTGIALAPMSVFAVLLLEQTRRLGVLTVYGMEALAAMALITELAGPLLTQWALRRAGESQSMREG